MFLASTCTCVVYGKRRCIQSAHVQVLAKNMAAKKTPYGFVAGVTSLYVSTLCPRIGIQTTIFSEHEVFEDCSIFLQKNVKIMKKL